MVKKKIIHRILILGLVLVVFLALVGISLDNYYHDYIDLSLYESPKIFKEYREHQSDFHYTMDSDTKIPNTLQSKTPKLKWFDSRDVIYL